MFKKTGLILLALTLAAGMAFVGCGGGSGGGGDPWFDDVVGLDLPYFGNGLVKDSSNVYTFGPGNTGVIQIHTGNFSSIASVKVEYVSIEDAPDSKITGKSATAALTASNWYEDSAKANISVGAAADADSAYYDLPKATSVQTLYFNTGAFNATSGWIYIEHNNWENTAAKTRMKIISVTPN